MDREALPRHRLRDPKIGADKIEVAGRGCKCVRPGGWVTKTDPVGEP